jgi:uncharacterized protein involved in outer membrane biogenesis
MRKWIVLAIVLAVAALAAIAARNLDAYLNSNRQWLAERLEQTLGREVAFDAVGVSFAGGFGVRLEGVRIADDPAFGRGDVLRADSVLIRLRLLPALRGRYEISRVALDHPSLVVRRTAAGLNISPAAGTGDTAAHTEGSATASPGSVLPAAAAIVIAYVDVDGGQLRYVDSTTDPPRRLELDALDLTASDVRPGQPVSFDLRASVFGAARPNVRARGSFGPLSVTDLADTPLNVELGATDVSVAQLANIPGFEDLREALEVEGPMSLTATASGTWHELGFAATLDAEGARVSYGNVLDKRAGLPLSLEVAGTRSADAVVVERATLGVLDAVITGSGTAVTGAEPRYDVALSSPTIALAGWERVLPGLADFTLAGSTSFDLYLQRTPSEAPLTLGGSVTLAGLALRDTSGVLIDGLSTTMKLDGASGTAPAASFRIAGEPATLAARLETAPKPTLTFTLACAKLPFSHSATPASADSGGTTLGDVKVDGAVRMAAGNLRLRAHALSAHGTISGVRYTDLTADVRAADGRVTFSPIAATTLGGTVHGEGVYDLRDDKRPSFNFETSLASVRLGALTAALGGANTPVVDGVADARLSLAGSGLDRASVLGSLSGGGDVALRNGVLRDTNLLAELVASLSGLPGLSALQAPELRTKFPVLFGGDDTPFDRLSARVSIADGRMSSDDIALETTDFSAKGRGVVGFDGALEVNATVEISEKLSNELVAHAGILERVTDKVRRIAVPVRIHGTLPDIEARPDLGRVAHTLQRGAVDDFIKGILDRERKHVEHGSPPAPTPPKAETAHPTLESGPPRDWYGAPVAPMPGTANRDAPDAKTPSEAAP